jgi:hypothetical protein
VRAGGAGVTYLLWNDHRLRLRGNDVLAALGWAGVRPVAVAESFLNAVPAGPDLAPLELPGADAPAPRRVAGTTARIGQLFRAAGQVYVMTAAGLAPIGPVSARLLQAAGRPVTDVSPQDVGQVLVDTAVEPPGLPAAVPEVRGAESPSAVVCATYRGPGGDRAVTVETFGQVPAGMTLDDQQVAPARPGTDGVPTADRVALAGGHAALVSAAAPSGSITPGNVFLVTDQGVKHPIPRQSVGAVQASLGYRGVTPVPVPAAVLALVPTGTAFDPVAAAQLTGPPVVPRPAPR